MKPRNAVPIEPSSSSCGQDYATRPPKTVSEVRQIHSPKAEKYQTISSLPRYGERWRVDSRLSSRPPHDKAPRGDILIRQTGKNGFPSETFDDNILEIVKKNPDMFNKLQKARWLSRWHQQDAGTKCSCSHRAKSFTAFSAFGRLFVTYESRTSESNIIQPTLLCLDQKYCKAR